MTVPDPFDRPPPPGPNDLRDNGLLDEYEVPVGEWAEQMVNWIDTRLGRDGQWAPVLEWVAAPIDLLLRIVVDGVLTGVSWIWVVAAVGLLAWLRRGARVAALSMAGLTLCGLLGTGFWDETARTMGIVTVVLGLCVAVGVPLGVAAARSPGLWAVVRVVLDAMQVVHPFVYLLPFLFFFGLGDTGGVLLTTVYALPPVVRLTHLGVTALPVDIVEAARSFGASPAQMMRDVYVPLARPAILTGLNQSLILALSMHVIASFLGGSGLGRLLFRGLTSVGMPQVIASGAAFVVVALVLDALTRPAEPGEPTLARRLHDAWTAGTTHAVTPARRVATAGDDGSIAVPLSPDEHRLAEIAVASSVAGMASIPLLRWSTGARISPHGRAADLGVVTGGFDGLAAAGGSWFGWVALAGFAFCATAGLATLSSTTARNRWLGPDGIVVAGLVATSAAVAFALVRPAPGAGTADLGAGVLVAVTCGALVTAAGARWTIAAPYVAATRDARAGRGWRGAIAAAGIAVSAIGATSGWTFDTRAEPVITTEVQAELDRLLALAENPDMAARAAADFRALMASIQFTEPVALDALSAGGSGLGWVTLALGAGSLVAIGFATARRAGESAAHVHSAVATGLGLAVTAVAVAWIGSIERVADPKLVSGVGAALTAVAGLVLASASSAAVASRARRRVDPDSLRAPPALGGTV